MFQKIIQKFRSKFVEPKVYALLIKGDSFRHLSVQVAYSLEEAFKKAKESFKEEQKKLGLDNLNLTIELFVLVSISSLFDKEVLIEIEKDSAVPDPDSKKNKLMKDIIEKKDLNSLELNRGIFTDEEYKYLSEKIR